MHGHTHSHTVNCSPQRMPWQALMPRPLMSFHQNNSAVDILVKIVGRGLFGRLRQGGNKVPPAPQPAAALCATLLPPRPTPTEGKEGHPQTLPSEPEKTCTGAGIPTAHFPQRYQN